MSSTTQVIDEWLGSQDYGDRDVIDSLRVLQYVCALVSERCAVLASICVAELCSRNNKVNLLVTHIVTDVCVSNVRLMSVMIYFMT